MIKKNKGYRYAVEVLEGKIPAPMYVKKQLKEFVEIADGKNEKYIINEKKYTLLLKLLRLIIMPKGAHKGKTVEKSLAGFQWVLIIAALCTVYRENTQKRRYQTVILEIARKNGKTFLVGLMFILLMLTEEKFAKLYSVAPDGTISREIKSQIEEIIKSSPALCGTSKGKAKFKILLNYILCNLTEIKYTPLNTSRNRMDSREPTAFVADEVGALPSPYPLEAMYSGQSNIQNPIGFIISTKYPTMFNPFEEQVDYAKKVLDGVVEDETVLALLFEPDDKDNWMENNEILQHANPLALEVPKIMEDLKAKRKRAIEMKSARENFLTKHCNIIYQGMGTETYVPVSEVQKGRVTKIDWTGKRLYVGLDLSITTDNCSVAIAAYDDENDIIEGEAMAFFPEGKMEEKSRTEKVNYQRFVEEAKAIACGDQIVDYGVIERYIMDIEENTGGKVVGVGFDRYNAMSTAQKLEAAGMTAVEIRQHSSVLHPATKILQEHILEGKFKYTENELLEINFENARVTQDTNLNMYVNKKRSAGKVDMVVALINACYLLMQNEIIEAPITWGAIEL